jgi:cytochrome b subunit of formate dehydrogenase
LFLSLVTLSFSLSLCSSSCARGAWALVATYKNSLIHFFIFHFSLSLSLYGSIVVCKRSFNKKVNHHHHHLQSKFLSLLPTPPT